MSAVQVSVTLSFPTLAAAHKYLSTVPHAARTTCTTVPDADND